MLTRGATTRITILNEMDEPTTVHWHGLELQSVYDGVAGWSRNGLAVAPGLKFRQRTDLLVEVAMFFDPGQTYVLLGAGGSARQVPGGERFWPRPAAQGAAGKFIRRTLWP